MTDAKGWYLFLVSKVLQREIKTITNRHLLWIAGLFIAFLLNVFVFPKHHDRMHFVYATIGYLSVMIPLGIGLELFRKPPPH